MSQLWTQISVCTLEDQETEQGQDEGCIEISGSRGSISGGESKIEPLYFVITYTVPPRKSEYHAQVDADISRARTKLPCLKGLSCARRVVNVPPREPADNNDWNPGRNVPGRARGQTGITVGGAFPSADRTVLYRTTLLQKPTPPPVTAAESRGTGRQAALAAAGDPTSLGVDVS